MACAFAPRRRGDNQGMSELPAPSALSLKLLAIETSTDRLSVALGTGACGADGWGHEGPGAAQASATLLPVVRDLLTQGGWALAELDALVFARGPGSFTGLRTACAIAQGLAYGAQSPSRLGGIPVLPVDTLLALAEEARWLVEQAGQEAPQTIVALLDARMGEVYGAVYALAHGAVQAEPLLAPFLCAPGELGRVLAGVVHAQGSGVWLAGNVFEVHGEALTDVGGARLTALPTAQALLRLAPALLRAGHAVAAFEAMPLYVRDKVARTTDEREQLRLAQLGAA